MSLDILFPHLHDFRLLSYSREATRLVLTCERVTPSAPCPVCGTAAHRIHSRYERRVWDLSVQNLQVLLHLHVRKFSCDRPDCSRRIFTQRLPQVTSPHGRFTFALRQFLGQLGREQGGASAARSATLQGMQVTARAILRFMHSLPLPPIAPPRIIGLDDWAWKRGQRYGALVVDLECKKPIALLADRSQQAVADFLKQHPTIEIVARDRSKEFAAALKEALPHAKQVADRWHLAKNLTEHLDKVVSARWKQLTKAVGEAEMPPEPIPLSPPARRPRQASGEARASRRCSPSLRQVFRQEPLPSGWEWGNGRSSTGWHKNMVPMRDLANHDAARSIGRRAICGSDGRRVSTTVWFGWRGVEGPGLHRIEPQCLSTSCEIPGASTPARIACFA